VFQIAIPPPSLPPVRDQIVAHALVRAAFTLV
jgi:hypothetical protein